MAMTLENCPFCGAIDVEAYPADRERSRWNVCCGNPGCVTRGDNDYLTEADAVSAWNRRALAGEQAGWRVPDEKPLPDLMMASYHEAIGWNACRDAMLAALPTSPTPDKEG